MRELSLSERLYNAAVQGQVHEMRSLFKEGADVSIETKHGTTPLLAASIAGQLDAVVVLLDEMDANRDHTDVDGFNALHLAVLSCKTSVARALLNRGANAFCPETVLGMVMHETAGW